MNKIKVGIIGGSGMEDPKFISDFNTKDINTPFGNPSSQLICGHISNIEVVILSRHGLDHSINPSNVNYRANISALKSEGCTHILAVTACGSLRVKIKPGHFVFPDQFIDRTTKRVCTFYDKEDVKHIPMAQPYCDNLRKLLIHSCKKLGFSFHDKGTIITIEGPRFSTKAESIMFRGWGCDIINMSTVPEVVLANELGIKYQNIAMSTDYDCWHKDHETVTMEMVYDVMSKNVDNVKKLIQDVVPSICKYK